jgi:hypothetical protein
MFENFSALEDGDGKAANGAMINARLQEGQKLHFFPAYAMIARMS